MILGVRDSHGSARSSPLPASPASAPTSHCLPQTLEVFFSASICHLPLSPEDEKSLVSSDGPRLASYCHTGDPCPPLSPCPSVCHTRPSHRAPVHAAAPPPPSKHPVTVAVTSTDRPRPLGSPSLINKVRSVPRTEQHSTTHPPTRHEATAPRLYSESFYHGDHSGLGIGI